jgi:intein-encoded DNA endonuclease-like protein
LAELENEKMETLLDEILLSKKRGENDIVSNKEEDLKSPIARLLIRNIESIKKIAEKEGINISSLLNKLKK